MAVLNIEKSFLTDNRSVLDFLNQSGQGLYIPLYQRDYSWDSDNIEQLLEDLTRGIQRIVLKELHDDSKEIRFLGTIITVVEPNRDNIYPVDKQAVPSRIEKLIDGQQRVSTIALMATLLTKRLTEIKNKIKENNPIYDDVNEICNIWIEQKLAPIFSFDLGRGVPKLKPKIIRGAQDFWTKNDAVDDAYKSELSNYLGHFIDAYVNKKTFPCLSKEKFGNTLLYQNGKRIEAWLKKVVSVAHEEQDNEEFATAENILESFSQELIWEFDRSNLVEIIHERDYQNKKSNSYILSELVQVLAVCHYLLDRCCFTIIQPTDDDWAFDMFQSLNATGTPLTAIETFKPTIVNTMDRLDLIFKDSISDKAFQKVEKFLSEATTAQQKNKRTNDYLTSFFVAYDGRTISTHFSYQRKILEKIYGDFENLKDKESFIKKMGNYADFYHSWIKYDGKDNSLFPNIGTSSEADLASMLVLFLKASNHKMAITILGRAYDTLLEKSVSADIFIKTVKMVTAYYFLWRSTYSNSGLDATYRDFFKKHKDSFSIDDFQQYVNKVLESKEINTFELWKNRAMNNLKYDYTSKEIIRLALLLVAHDTIPDDNCKGGIKIGRDNCSRYLTLEKWLSNDLKTIEHIAPQSNKNNLWDQALYEEPMDDYQSIGNLTLLPQDLNSSIGNKSWKEKLLYYQCVAERDAEKIANIEQIAQDMGIELHSSTCDLLKASNFNNHLLPISSMSQYDDWNKEIVTKRTEIILDILWKRVSQWIII